MLHLVPKHVPPLSVMLPDLGSPTAERLSTLLGVSVRTVRRWIAEDEAPRPAGLALWWLTQWGAGSLVQHIEHGEHLARGLIESLRADNAALRRELARVVHHGQFDTANDPTMVDSTGYAPVPETPSATVVPMPRRRA